MSNTCIVVEDGVIQCAHGGKVVLKSSVANHVIGGKKPLHDIDLMGAPIQGCPYYAPVGGNCTSVASITSAVTEGNVASQGKNYLLRVDGCKTDKGAALVLVDPGQTNSVVPVKSGGSGGSITAKELEEAKVDTRENILKEKYRIYPIRKSNGDVRGLRGARDFRVLRNFHYVGSANYMHDKVVTKTDAYLYVKADGEVTEYKVLNRGDTFNPVMQKVQFIDMRTGTVRKHIPFYKEEGSVEFIYANVRLSESDQGAFTPTILSVGDASSPYVKHHKNYSRAIKHKEKEIKEVFLSNDEAKKLNKPYLNMVLELEDPIGEIEDLYNDYEFSYHRHYGMNKALIDGIRAKNQYPYAVADMLDYLYVSEADKKASDEHIQKLKDQYKIMSSIIMKDFTKALSKEKKSDIRLNLGKLLNPDFELAKEYLDEVKFISKSFFNTGYAFDLIVDNKRFLYDPLNVYPQVAGQKDRNGQALFTPLKLSGKNYTKIKDHPMDALGLIIFSFCYSNAYEVELSQFPELVTAREEFYYLLKTAKPLPQINEKSIEEVRTELKDQTELMSILDRKDPLLEEFESLESVHKELSFYANTSKSFASLLTGSPKKNFYQNTSFKIPHIIAQEIEMKISKGPLKEVLAAYMKITDLSDNEKCLDYYEFGLNLAYMLCAPRANSDEETDLLSPFNKGFEAIYDLLSHVTKGMDGLSEEQAVWLHGREIKEHYLQALFALIGHGLGHKKTNTTRKTNAQSLLDLLPIKVSKITANFSNPNDHNQAQDLKVKTQVEELYEKLKNLNGISSKFPDFDEHLKSGAFGGNTSAINKPGLGGNKVDVKVPKWLIDTKNLNTYKNALTTTKSLAGIMTFMSIGEYLIKGKSEQIKVHNLIGFMNDSISLTKVLSEKGAKAETKSVAAISRFINKGAALDAASYKLLAKLGAVGLIFNAANELSGMDANDIDGKVSVATKNAMVLAFLFTPGWVAVAGIVIVEVAWLYFKDYVVDSPLEVYLRKNLFFDAKVYHENLSFFSSIFNSTPPEKSRLAPLLLESIHAEGGEYIYMGKPTPAKEIKGFLNIKTLRTFIADNADTNSKEIEVAMRNELNTLKQVLYGYKIEISNEKRTIDLPMDKISFQTQLSIPSEVLDKNRHILFYKDKQYEKIEISSLGTSGKNRIFDTAKDIAFTTIDALQDREDEEVSFIVVNDDITLKYKMQYHTRFEDIGYYSGSHGSTLFMIDHFENVGLNKEDLKHIQSLEDKGN